MEFTLTCGSEHDALHRRQLTTPIFRYQGRNTIIDAANIVINVIVIDYNIKHNESQSMFPNIKNTDTNKHTNNTHTV